MTFILIGDSLKELFDIIFPSLVFFLLGSVFFTLVDKWPKLKCSEQKSWWKNHSIRTDIFYIIFNPFFKMILRLIPLTIIVGLLLCFVPWENVYTYLVNGLGPFGRLSASVQFIVFVLVSDFFSYWSHRIFHGKYLWPIHAIHHGPHDVDWTTSYRFHPFNLALGPSFVNSLSILLGFSPTNILLIAPLEVIMAYFVHANLNISLGPLKYVISTPIFHRWHHTHAGEGGQSNFGALFSFWDVIFGTFYFPKNRLPTIYGIDHLEIDENYLSQLIFPFKAYLHKMSRLKLYNLIK